MPERFGGDSWDIRVTDWSVLRVANPRMEIREYRPQLHRPLDCPDYDRIYNSEYYKWEGACKNFDMTRLYCVFCNACPMSNAFSKIPFDVRSHCDIFMGW